MDTEFSMEPSKRVWKLSFVVMLMLLFGLAGCAATTDQSYSGEQSDVDDVEYLSSYGEWMDTPPYGDVWLPRVVPDWEPFYYGHWSWTNYGWTWISYEPYGWLVYHYGYWGYEPGIGWFWVPDETWSPARVEWYTFDDYTAWAPIPPRGIVWPDPWDPYNVNVWVVVDIKHFTAEDIGSHRIREFHSRGIVRPRTIIKRAPDVQSVSRLLKRDIPTVQVREREANILPRGASTPKTVVEPRERTLKEMVLPVKEKRKVDKHSPRVEREVLAPRKKAQEPAKTAPEKKSDTKRKKRQ